MITPNIIHKLDQDTVNRVQQALAAQRRDNGLRCIEQAWFAILRGDAKHAFDLTARARALLGLPEVPPNA